MKKSILLFTFLSFVCIANLQAQPKLFSLYTDSASLVDDAKPMVADFNKRVNAIRPGLNFKVGIVIYTTPAMVYYAPKAKNVVTSLYHQLPAEHKTFFTRYSANEVEGKKFFAGFFNGFYIAHELGHGLVAAYGLMDEKAMYQEELDVNILAMNYWFSVGKAAELEQCYQFAKAFLSKVPDPVPAGEENRIKWFNEHYWELGPFPEKYGYFQFSQFVDIYENYDRVPFEEYLETYIKQLELRKK